MAREPLRPMSLNVLCSPYDGPPLVKPPKCLLLEQECPVQEDDKNKHDAGAIPSFNELLDSIFERHHNPHAQQDSRPGTVTATAEVTLFDQQYKTQQMATGTPCDINRRRCAPPNLEGGPPTALRRYESKQIQNRTEKVESDMTRHQPKLGVNSNSYRWPTRLQSTDPGFSQTYGPADTTCVSRAVLNTRSPAVGIAALPILYSNDTRPAASSSECSRNQRTSPRPYLPV